MVYQRSIYRPSDAAYEKTRDRHDGRIKYAFRDSRSGNQPAKNQKTRRAETDSEAQAQTRASGVMSFFGMAREEADKSRSIPSRKSNPGMNRARENATARFPRTAAGNNVRRAYNAPGAKQAQRARNTGYAKQNYGAERVDPVNVNGGVFFAAYNKARPVRALASNVFFRNKSIHKRKTMSEDELRSRISRVPGSRAVSVKTDAGADGDKSKFRRFLDSFKDNRKAEHRVKSAPFPFSYVAVIAICAIMAAVLLLSQSEINEYEKMIHVVEADQAAEDEAVSKLELEVEYREDIRNIQEIAVNYLGMVNSDVARTDFVSVPSEDKVSILKTETEEKEGGFSALLSAIGEGIGKFGEYFN